MSISIRQIKPEDAPAVKLLSNQLGYSISIEETENNIKAILANNDHSAFVAVQDETIVGWVHVFAAIHLESGPSCEIRGLVTDDRHRRKGIGRLLVEKSKEWGRSKGRQVLRLRCNMKRTEAHAFYFSIGFKETKQQMVFQISTT